MANPRHTQADLNAAEDQLAAARAGMMPLDLTKADLAAGVDALKRRRGGGLDAYSGKVAEALKAKLGAVAPAREKIADALKGLTAKELTEARNDPVTAALIKALNLPDPGPISVHELTFKHADPLEYALLRKAGIRIKMSAVNTIAVTRGGKPLQLTQKELDMAGENDISGLALSVLNRTPLDADTRTLMAAAVEARRTYTRDTVSRLHAANNDKDALDTLDRMMRGAFSPAEANFLWARYWRHGPEPALQAR
jgi:hypothetical protein